MNVTSRIESGNYINFPVKLPDSKTIVKKDLVDKNLNPVDGFQKQTDYIESATSFNPDKFTSKKDSPETEYTEKFVSNSVSLKDSPEMTLNTNGTISLIDDSTGLKTPVQSEGINFAKMFGIDTQSPANVPQNFTTAEVEKHYFADGLENAKGIEGLSPEGQKLYKTIKDKYHDFRKIRLLIS